MKVLFLSTVVVVALISGCANAPLSGVSSPELSMLQPRQAILLAAEAAPASIPGIFVLSVKATGTQNNYVYLNSEADYRDQRCLSIALTPEAAQQLTTRLGESPLIALKGRTILVQGAAIRTRINFFSNGLATDKYYYQTHVNVTNADQITVR